MIDLINSNAADIELELEWLNHVIDARMRHYFASDPVAVRPGPSAPPILGDSPYAAIVKPLREEQHLAFLLALVPHLRPRLLDVFFLCNEMYHRPFTEFGGQVIGGAFHATGETLAFLLAGNDLTARFAGTRFLFDPQDELMLSGALSLEANTEIDRGTLPLLQHRLVLAPSVIRRCITGANDPPPPSDHFPAARISTNLAWSDLVLDAQSLNQLQDIQRWIKHHSTLRNAWGMADHMRPGYRCLFHGPPGTGKTLAATLLGKQTGRDVYRVNLSLAISKYIGETEKNLARLFDQAENDNWILFFDEADALFGKRSEIANSHDRYANQEVAYLLQRIEQFDGIVILATDLKAHIDPAFMRRFESVIQFPAPTASDRLLLWEKLMPPMEQCLRDPDIDLRAIAQKHALTAAAIANVVREACIVALDEKCTSGLPTITLAILQAALQNEYRKEDQHLP